MFSNFSNCLLYVFSGVLDGPFAQWLCLFSVLGARSASSWSTRVSDARQRVLHCVRVSWRRRIQRGCYSGVRSNGDVAGSGDGSWHIFYDSVYLLFKKTFNLIKKIFLSVYTFNHNIVKNKLK